MPLYEYVSPEGSTVLLPRPVDLRDAPVQIAGVSFRRRTVPSRITVGSGARPPTMGAKLAEGYKRLEQAGQYSDKNPNYLSEAEIKRAMTLPDVPEPVETNA
jgi:hypothetical protein